jgi:FkbM family methyltransferase
MTTVVKYFEKSIIMHYLPFKSSCAVNQSIINKRVWEKNVLELYKKYLNKSSVVLDIGSNLGCHTVPLSLLCKKVYAFEPQKKIYELLSKTITDNEITNVELFNNIVSDGKCESLEFLNTDCGRASVAVYRPRLSGVITTEKCITIDSLNLQQCDLMKIDVEGGEWAVLNGAHLTLTKYMPIIILETWKTKKNMVKLVNFTQKYGYTFNYLSSDNYLLTKK